MKTLIVGLLAALGLVNTTDVINPKEFGITEVAYIPAISEYRPFRVMNSYISVRDRTEYRIQPAPKKARNEND